MNEVFGGAQSSQSRISLSTKSNHKAFIKFNNKIIESDLSRRAAQILSNSNLTINKDPSP